MERAHKYTVTKKIKMATTWTCEHEYKRVCASLGSLLSMKNPLSHTVCDCIHLLVSGISFWLGSVGSLMLSHAHGFPLWPYCQHFLFSSLFFFHCIASFSVPLCGYAVSRLLCLFIGIPSSIGRWMRRGKPTNTCKSKLFQWTISFKCLSMVTFKQIGDGASVKRARIRAPSFHALSYLQVWIN